MTQTARCSLHQAIVIEALNEASQIFAEYLEPSPRNAEATLDQPIRTLERLGAAVERLERGGWA
jgi:hypothetical protein